MIVYKLTAYYLGNEVAYDILFSTKEKAEDYMQKEIKDYIYFKKVNPVTQFTYDYVITEETVR